MKNEMKLVVLLVALLAVTAAGAYPIDLDLDGTHVSVETANAPAVLSGAVHWSEADARVIVDALVAAGRDDAIPDVLGGLRMGDQTETCFRWELPDGLDILATLPGKVVVDAGHPVWTRDQLAAIQAALATEYESGAVPSLFGLTVATFEPTAEGLYLNQPAAGTPTPLDPECNQCLQGKSCFIGGQARCCTGPQLTTCMACRSCVKVKPKAPKVEGVGIAE